MSIAQSDEQYHDVIYQEPAMISWFRCWATCVSRCTATAWNI